MKTAAALFMACGLAAPTFAEVISQRLGTGAPPAQIGPVFMSTPPFHADLFSDRVDVQDGQGHVLLTFSDPMSCRAIGFGWSTWSHGYTGNVFYSNGLTDITITFAHRVTAAYLYVEPNPFGVHEISVTGSDGSSTASFSDGIEGDGGAAGYAFHTRSFAESLVAIRIVGDTDFGVGEFGYSGAAPAPGALSFLAIAGLTARRRRC